MSHYIDTQHAPKRGVAKLSGRQLVEIITGVAVVIALVVATYAYVNTAEPIADSRTAAGSATLTGVEHSALDPFETQFVSPQVDTAINPATLELITHSALDPFEMR